MRPQDTVHWSVRYADGSQDAGYRSLTVARADSAVGVAP
jgi:hypothetical protein